MIYLILTAVCAAAAAVSIRKEPRNILNGVLIEASLAFCLLSAALLFYSIPQTQFINVIGLILIVISLIATGIGLMINAVIVMKKESICMAHALPLAWGILFLIVGYAWYQNAFVIIAGHENYVLILSILFSLLFYVPLALGAFFFYTLVYQKLPKQTNCDFIIVLGCQIRSDGTVTPLLKGRLDTALSWYEKGCKKAKIIISGGQGSDEVTSEARAMKNYLLSQGVPEEAILEESKSTTTRENLLFSKAIMDHEKEHHTSLVATNDYHVLRAVLLAKSLKMNTQGIGSKTAAYYYPAAILREYAAIVFKYKLPMILYLAAIIMYQIIKIKFIL